MEIRANRSAHIVVSILCWVMLAACAAAEASRRADANPAVTPVSVARTVFETHFAGDMAFTRESVARKAAWLTPDLLQRIDAYFDRPQNPDEVPVINGDPFTNSQEYPTRYSVGTARLTARGAEVPVWLTDGPRVRVVYVLLQRDGAQWRIDDLRYEDSSTLRRHLSAQNAS